MRVLILLPMLLFAGGTTPEPRFRITPAQISVGTSYSGADVRIEGAADAGSNIIITVTGSDREEQFNHKARYGPIWASGGRLRISGVPSLFLRFSSAPVDSLLGPDTVRQMGLDTASLAARMHIEPRPRDRRAEDAIRRDYLALKTADRVYRIDEPGVQTGSRFSLRFHWPRKAPPGVYQVHVYEIRDRTVVRESSMPYSVVRTGFPAWLAGLAESRASLYGLVAVLIGALAGFGIDFLTTCLLGKKKRAVAH
jgi:hypothetical protein